MHRRDGHGVWPSRRPAAGVGFPALPAAASAGSGLCPASQPGKRASHTGCHALPLSSIRSWDPRLYTLGLLSRAHGLASLNNLPANRITCFKYQVTVTKRLPPNHTLQVTRNVTPLSSGSVKTKRNPQLQVSVSLPVVLITCSNTSNENRKPSSAGTQLLCLKIRFRPGGCFLTKSKDNCLFSF